VLAVALVLLALSLSHLATGIALVTGAGPSDGWLMAIGIDLGFIVLELAVLAAVVRYAAPAIVGTLAASAARPQGSSHDPMARLKNILNPCSVSYSTTSFLVWAASNPSVSPGSVPQSQSEANPSRRKIPCEQGKQQGSFENTARLGPKPPGKPVIFHGLGQKIP
jgi:hypothetical protein